MLNQKCTTQDNHRWGFCLQSCAKCGVKDKITVNWCEDSRQYFCYSCNREMAVA